MSWQSVVALLRLVGSVLGIAALIRPQPRLLLPSRRRGAIVLAASLVFGVTGLYAMSRHVCCKPPPVPCCRQVPDTEAGKKDVEKVVPPS
jgi:hypothetical protein